MKRFVLALLIAAIASAGATLARDAVIVPPQEGPSFYGYAPNKCVVIFKEGAQVEGNPALADIAERFQVGRFARQFPAAKESHPVDRKLTRYFKAHFPEGNLDKVMEAYSKLPFVDRVEPIGIYRMTATPNDFHYDDSTGGFPYTQWHYWDTYGISADLAWDKETGSTDVIVAVADAGVKYDHFELGGTDPPGPNDNVTNGNIWVNDGEIPGNSIDDDNNGYVDDVIGWDFVAAASQCSDADCSVEDNDPRDGNGHGTHVAGTIGAITNNYADWGVAGIAGGWNDGTPDVNANGVKIMCLRIGWNSPLGGLVGMDYAAEAFYYIATMVDKGYNITAVNCSWGSSSYLADATDAVLARDVMVIVAAGNSNSSSCDYLGCREDCLDVGGTERSGNPYSGSNYGAWVDIAAPAVDILSTYTDPGDPAGDYIALMTGTSMACPHVVGVAGLLESYDPSLTSAQKWAIITDVNNTKPYNQTKYVGVGIVDARKCLDAVGPQCDLVADFSGSPTTGCAGMTVNFTDLSTGTGIDGWSWDFGDGVGTSTAQNPSYAYNNAGTYTVTLTISSSSQGCNDTEIKTGYITVNPAPVADFVGSPLTGTAPLTVDFTDLSTGNPASWSWDFGDGVGTSAKQNPSYTYNNAGTYTVTLTATNACGSDVEQKIDYITVDPCVAPVADFSGTPTSGCAALTVDFTDLSTGNPDTWSWDFGDGTGTSTQQNPSYTYNNPGTYTVTLAAGNACGTDDEIKVDYITVDACGPDQAYANADLPVAGTVSGNFTNTLASDNVYEGITEIEYANHPRKRSSYLEHKWTINVGSGGSSMMFYVEGYRPANAEGDNFVFAYSTDNVNFVDMVTIASGTDQVYSYSMPAGLTGTIYIRVLDTDRSWGNTAFDAVYVDEMYIEFSSTPGPPVADFVGNPLSGDEPLTVDFTDLSTGNPTSWSWNFGDGVGTSTDQNPIYTYNNAGTYTVELTATNAYGSDTETKVDYITVTVPGDDYSHVHDMVVGRTRSGPNTLGTCTVTIYDDNNLPLANATVHVTYDGPTGGSGNGVTGSDGTVYFETTGFKKPSGEWCFEVTDVTHATHTYDPASNNVTNACESGPVYGANPNASVPENFSLGNKPNPFNPSTTIAFALPNATHVRLEVFNIVGQRVTLLADGYYQPGEYSAEWDGSGVASGVYLYRLTTDTFSQTRQMVLMK